VQGNGLCLLIVYQVRWSDGNLANLSAPAARSICFGGAQPFLPFGFSGRLCLRSQSCCPFFVTWKTSCERRLLTCQGKISIWIYLWCESIVWTIASHPQTALCLMIRGLHCTTFGKGFLYVAYVKSCWIILGTLNWQLRGWQKGHRTPVQAMFLQSVALYFASWRQREREWSPTRIVTHVVRLGKCAMAKIHGEIHGEILVCFWWGIECHACHHSGRILVSPTVVRYIDLRFSCFTVFWYILTMYCMYWQAWLIALVTVVPDLILHYPPPSLLRGSHEV
jgi:hypothetical protein